MHEDDGMMGQFIVSTNPLGLIENIRIQNVSVFPNPVKTLLSIESQNDSFTKVEVIDNLGRLLWTQKIIESKRVNVDISNFDDGIYTLCIYTNKGVICKKIIKN
jgi:hypothetical protein